MRAIETSRSLYFEDFTCAVSDKKEVTQIVLIRNKSFKLNFCVFGLGCVGTRESTASSLP